MPRVQPCRPHPGLSTPTGQSGLVCAGSAYSVAHFYNELWGIALWLRGESRKWRKERDAWAKQGQPARTLAGARLDDYEYAERRCALASMIHCFLVLEAYINTYAAWFAAPVEGAPMGRGLYEKLERLPPDTKWVLFPQLVTGRAAFEPGREPLQSFVKLKKMRDHFIVHHKPRMTLDEDILVGENGEPRLNPERRGSWCDPLTQWNDPTCDADGAEWACGVVQSMVDEIVKATPGWQGGPALSLQPFSN